MDKTKFQNKYRIKSTRLENWDYSEDWWYFITICVKDFRKCLGKIEKGEIKLTKIGFIVNEELEKTEKLRKNVKIDEYVIMPNHVHMILIIDNSYFRNISNKNLNYCRDALQCVCTGSNKFGPQKNNLASIVRGFKGSVKRRCNKLNINFKWQARFYEHIIRNEVSLEKIRLYIRNNPYKWEADEYYW